MGQSDRLQDVGHQVARDRVGELAVDSSTGVLLLARWWLGRDSGVDLGIPGRVGYRIVVYKPMVLPWQRVLRMSHNRWTVAKGGIRTAATSAAAASEGGGGEATGGTPLEDDPTHLDALGNPSHSVLKDPNPVLILKVGLIPPPPGNEIGGGGD